MENIKNIAKQYIIENSVEIAKKEDFNFSPLTYKNSKQLYLFGEILAENYTQALEKSWKIMKKYKIIPSLKREGVLVESIPENVKII